MFNRVTISTLLKTVIMTLGVAVIVMLSLTAWESWSRLATASQAEAAANAEGNLFTALYNMRIDRATTSIDLNSDRTGVSQVLGKARTAEMAALQSALDYLPQVDFPDQQALTAELADRVKRITASHDETAAALAQPKASRPAGLAEPAFKEANELFGLIDKLSTRVATAIKLQDPFIDQMMEIKQLAWTMRNWSGEATLVILNPMAGKPLSPYGDERLHHLCQQIHRHLGVAQRDRERPVFAGASHRHDRQGRQRILRPGLCDAAHEDADGADCRPASGHELG